VRTHHHRPGGLAAAPGGVAAGVPAAAWWASWNAPAGSPTPAHRGPCTRARSAAAGSAPWTRRPTGSTRRTPPN